MLKIFMGLAGGLTGAVIAGLAWALPVLLVAGSDYGPIIAVQGGLVAVVLGAPTGAVTGANGKPTVVAVVTSMFLVGFIGLLLMLAADATLKEVLLLDGILVAGIGLASVLGGIAGGVVRRFALKRAA